MECSKFRAYANQIGYLPVKFVNNSIGLTLIFLSLVTWTCAPYKLPMHKYDQRPKSGRKQAASSTQKKRSSARKSTKKASPEPDILYGRHTVIEALKNPDRRFCRFLASENAARHLAQILPVAVIAPEVVPISVIRGISGPTAVHQGVLLEAFPLPSSDLQSLMERPGLIVVMDQITDPHNVGAILRSCAAFGVAGMIMTARHSPNASSVLAKSASGALEHVPIAKVTNLSRCLKELKANQINCIGLDSDAEDELEAVVAGKSRVALVFGAEGKGLRQKTRETCTALARVDMPGAISSLNVSNAAALALYIATRSSS